MPKEDEGGRVGERVVKAWPKSAMRGFRYVCAVEELKFRQLEQVLGIYPAPGEEETESRIFAGFRSRWIIPWECRCCTPERISWKI